MSAAGGQWVGDRLGVTLSTTSSPVGLRVEDLAGLAVRRNPKRAHLLVSTVLGKHVPTDPRIVYGAGLLLGLLVGAALDGTRPPTPSDLAPLGDLLSTALAGDPADADRFGRAVRRAADDQIMPAHPVTVLGYAETAVAVGHAVADALPGSDYLHSTRLQTTVPPVGGFEESHSHATSHQLCPLDPGLLVGDAAAARTLVLVDDELTTGRTVLNTIAELHRLAPRQRYVVAALIDMRTDDDAALMQARARDLGLELDVVALARGAVHLPEELPALAAAVTAEVPVARSVTGKAAPDANHTRPDPAFDTPFDRVQQLPTSGRHGISADQRQRLRSWLAAAVRPGSVLPGERVLVLGLEEDMAAPLLFAEALAASEPTATVRFSTTTRSPAVAVDDPGYPLRTALLFAAGAGVTGRNDRVRYAYNVRPATGQPGWDRIIYFEGADALDQRSGGRFSDVRHGRVGSLLDQLSDCAPRVSMLTLPPDGSHSGVTSTPLEPLRGPQFGSYHPAEVGWLLKDLSHASLEAPTEDRERDIQAGRAHYAESLPIEFQPDAAYLDLFHQTVAESATRLARDVGVVCELVRAERGEAPVLASLARAGVPIGILMRRWFAFAHQVDVPHYALSIVRGRGIDEVALGWLAARHRCENVVFVDGWTGKGAITRELHAAIDGVNWALDTRFNPEMVVLADPGRCVRTFGTRDDYLIPSACLNSTVSGLVSRTVLNDELIGPRDFHGAKFYAELADADVSNLFLDAVSAQFPAVLDQVRRDWPVLQADDREPDWAGWAAVERISEQYGIGQVNLVKPGVGETTRVLLRRVPERVLIRPGHEDDLQHVLVLAEQRGVPVETVDDLPYSCVGLIRPQDGDG